MMRRSMHQMMGGQYYNGTMGISWLFFLVSVGVFLFIFGGVIKGSFNKLLNETYFYSEHVGHPEYAPKQTKQRKVLWKSCRCNYCIHLLALSCGTLSIY